MFVNKINFRSLIFLLSYFVGSSVFALSTEEIQGLLTKSFSGQQQSNGIFLLSIDDNPLRFHIIEKKSDKSSKSSTLVIIAPSDVSEQNIKRIHPTCLYLKIREDNTGYLEYISTKNLVSGAEKNCGIPKTVTKKGEYLLSIVDKIANALKMSSISLKDAATIKCQKNNKDINLRLLNLVKKEKGWYEKNGYNSVNDEKYKNSYEELSNYNANEMIRLINNIDENDIRNAIDSLMKKDQTFRVKEAVSYWQNFTSNRKIFNQHLSQIKQEPNMSFSNFANSFKDRCDVYTDIIDLLMPKLMAFRFDSFKREFEEFGKFPWMSSYADFRFTAEHLIKKF